jgi:hypothetical protein
LRPQPKKSELSIRVCRECAADYCGDIEERLTLFKCACARLILPHELKYLAAIEAAETNVLRGYRAYERRSIVDNGSINLQSVNEGLSAEIPGAAAVLALEMRCLLFFSAHDNHPSCRHRIYASSYLNHSDRDQAA